MRIPLYVELNGKKIVVIGGGGVGTSRAKKFLSYGAKVVVISLDFSDELKKLEKEGKVELVYGDAKRADFLEKYVKDAFMVVVAVGGREVNEVVERLSKKYNFLKNFANDAERTEVVVPFEGEVEGIKIAVTTEGKSGVVARIVRDKILEMIKSDRETINLLRAMHFFKKYMKDEEIPVDIRMKMYFAISSDEKFLELVKSGRIEDAKTYAVNFLREYLSGERDLDESKTRIQF